MRIRQATVDDTRILGEIQLDSWRTMLVGIAPESYFDHFSYEERQQDWRDLLRLTDDIILVAEADDQQVVGYACTRSHQSVGCQSELTSIHIRQANRRQGIGQALIVEMERHLQQRGLRSLALWTPENNQAARRLYEKLGGRLAGEKDTNLDDVKMREVAYVWDDIETLSI